jgi:hypothetical protein
VEVFGEKPEVLVVGTGCYGLMKVLPETESRLRTEGIRLVAEKNGKAYMTYNDLPRSGRVVGAFHLTC